VGIQGQVNVADQIRDALIAAGILENVVEDHHCRENVLELIAGCSTELFPEFTLADFLTQIVQIGNGGEFYLNNEVLREALVNDEEDDNLQLTIEGCCGYACEVSKERCLCDEATYHALTDVFGEEATELLQQFRDTCLVDNEELVFDLTAFHTHGCGRRYRRTAREFQCGLETNA